MKKFVLILFCGVELLGPVGAAAKAFTIEYDKGFKYMEYIGYAEDASFPYIEQCVVQNESSSREAAVTKIREDREGAERSKKETGHSNWWQAYNAGVGESHLSHLLGWRVASDYGEGNHVLVAMTVYDRNGLIQGISPSYYSEKKGFNSKEFNKKVSQVMPDLLDDITLEQLKNKYNPKCHSFLLLDTFKIKKDSFTVDVGFTLDGDKNVIGYTFFLFKVKKKFERNKICC